MQTVQIEKRRRGVFGWLVAIIFWGFNVFMLISLVTGLSGVSDVYQSANSQAEQAGAAIGASLGIGALLVIWFLGAAILGLMMFFTRGKKIITTVEKP